MRTLLVFLTLSAAALGQQGNGPTQHFAIQSWTNPTGTLTGNCVYRSQAAGGPYGPAIFCSTVPITTYTDFTVLTGQTYYFVVTAYTAGPPFEEGLYSNEVKEVIPLAPAATGLSGTTK